MGIDCVFYFSIYSGGINGDAFTTYLGELLQHISTVSSSQAYIIMDNAPIHRVQSMSTLFEPYSSTEAVYLPPYTPQLNPIEHLFLSGREK